MGELTIVKMYTYIVIIMNIIITYIFVLKLISISSLLCYSSLEKVLFELHEAANSVLLFLERLCLCLSVLCDLTKIKIFPGLLFSFVTFFCYKSNLPLLFLGLSSLNSRNIILF